jgi:hypothetical protein
MDLVSSVVFVVMVGTMFVVGYCLSRTATPNATPPERIESGRSIPTTPLPGYYRRNYLANMQQRRLVSQGPDCVELRFGVGAKVIGTISLAVGILQLGIFCACVAEVGWGGQQASGLLIGLLPLAGGLAFSLSGLFLLLNLGLVRFNRAVGELTIRRPLRQYKHSLADVRAVQVVSGSRYSSEDGDYETVQINLVLNDPAQPRRNVVESHEGEATCQIARQLADFLRVPLWDVVSEAGAGTASPITPPAP